MFLQFRALHTTCSEVKPLVGSDEGNVARKQLQAEDDQEMRALRDLRVSSPRKRLPCTLEIKRDSRVLSSNQWILGTLSFKWRISRLMVNGEVAEMSQ